MGKDKHIELYSEPVEFFRNLVTTATQNQNIAIQQETEFYLVTLLTQFMQGDSLKQSEEDPLAIQLHKAMEANKIEQIRVLKDLGDFSLYISGFFPDSLKRKLIDIDYYMAMGGIAYHRLSSTLAQEALQSLYKDLCERFGIYVDILSEISDHAFSHTDKDILRLYEKNGC